MNKFNAKKTVMYGQTFDSRKEAERYLVLRSMEQNGVITGLERQVKFVLIPKQTGEREASYTADFVYKDGSGKTVVEDVKGYKKGSAYGLFVLKRKLMLLVHGIKVKEV